MAIGTDDGIWKFGTQDKQDSSSASVADNKFSITGDVITNWQNDDNAPFGSAVIRCQFATAPTVGSIGLYARLMNVEGTNDENVPDDTNNGYSPNFVGSFAIDFGVASATDMSLTIQTFSMPGLKLDQETEWYIKNENTGQTISASWTLHVTPKTIGPKA